jgi:hypothetical protein
MNALIDISGQRFGRLKVVQRAPKKRTSGGGAKWVCNCDCGARSIVGGSDLRSGRIVSCGCHGRQTGLINITHGDLRHYKKTPEYVAWRTMLARCNNPGNDAFQWYGAKGIGVCEKWRSDFAAFLADLGRKPNPNLVLGRIDKDGDYEPDNCVWMEKKTARWPHKPPSGPPDTHSSRPKTSRVRQPR